MHRLSNILQNMGMSLSIANIKTGVVCLSTSTLFAERLSGGAVQRKPFSEQQAADTGRSRMVPRACAL